MFDSSSVTCKILRVMNDGHTPDTAVLHLKVSFNYTFFLCVIWISNYNVRFKMSIHQLHLPFNIYVDTL